MSLRRKIIFIAFLTILASYISLPKTFSIFGASFTRIDPDFNIGKLHFKKNFDLVLGLDLAGGSRLVFEADTSGLKESEKKVALESLRSVIERRVNLFGVSEPNVQLSNFEGKDRIGVELPGVSDLEQAKSIIGETAYLFFGEIGKSDQKDEKDTIKPTDLTGRDLKRASVVFSREVSKPSVQIEFTEEGSKKFSEITERNVGKPLPIILDGEVVSAPIVKQKIIGGTAVITGDFSVSEAKNLSIQLNAGALPVPIFLVEQRTIGASLGAESIDRSVRAGIIGISMVALFMLLSYGKFGLVADVALLIFGVLTLSMYKLIPVVLTLPGIAGFLLSVGMAVDSNILIFERFKEEIKRRDFANALEVSFGRAWDSIRDANIATLVTAFVLANPLDFNFLHTSGPVRGFAITLSLGIFTSLFTGIFVTRNLLRMFIKSRR
jgi:preprotein translocase subunit SecD